MPDGSQPSVGDAAPFLRLQRTLRGNMPALDGIRGAAILLVLAHQFILDGPIRSSIGKAINVALQVGWIGVHLFFVLSGFLITGILLDTRHSPRYWRSFYARRALRIFPLYYLLLGALALVPARWPYWLYLSNWLFVTGSVAASNLGHTWSLAVEEQFYVVWPLAVRALSEKALAWLCVSLVVGALAARVAMRALGVDPSVIYVATFTRMDALACGALVAIVLRREAWCAHALRRLPALTFAAAFSVLACAATSHGLARVHVVTQTIGLTALAAWFSCLLMVAVVQTSNQRGKWKDVLSTAPLRLFGRYSYAIYLVHLPVHVWLSTRLFAGQAAATESGSVIRNLLYIACACVLMLGLGFLSYALVERPLLALKRFFPKDLG
jgi:peptidoglycan/LPS O-acetylase OafA/YrhL